MVDRHWEDHIDAMDELKHGMYLRSYAQRNPVEEYRFEGFAMFDEMIAAIREETVRLVLTIPVKVERPIQREQGVAQIGIHNEKIKVMRPQTVQIPVVSSGVGAVHAYPRKGGTPDPA